MRAASGGREWGSAVTPVDLGSTWLRPRCHDGAAEPQRARRRPPGVVDRSRRPRRGRPPTVVPVTDIAADRARLLEIIRDRAIVHGRFTLSSGKEADYYVDLRRVTLDGEASPLVGRV